MWLTPRSSSSSKVRSASSCVTRLNAAAPKMVRVLWCPVRPNGCFSIIVPLPALCAHGDPDGPGVATAPHRSPTPSATTCRVELAIELDLPPVLAGVDDRVLDAPGGRERCLALRLQPPH